MAYWLILSYQPLWRSSSMKIASARASSYAYSRLTSPWMRTPRQGEGMAVDHCARQAEFDADTPNFVLEQFAQRFALPALTGSMQE